MNQKSAVSFMTRIRDAFRQEKGETLLGTLLGVLLLSVMTASFAGVIFATAASTGRAGEITKRVSYLNAYSSDALSDQRVEKVATPAGWTATTVPSGYDFSVTKNEPSFGNTPMYQWGRTVNGVVEVYTSMSKPKSAASSDTCSAANSVTNQAVFLNSCLIVSASGLATYCPSGQAVSPCKSPIANPLGANRDWRSQVYTAALTSVTPATAPNPSANTAGVPATQPAAVAVTTSTTITATFTTSTAARTVKYVFLGTGTTAARIVTFTPQSGTAVNANVNANNTTTYNTGTMTLPANSTTVTVKVNGNMNLQNMVLYINK